MIINRAAKGRIYPNKTQQHKIDTTLDCCRYVYNTMLARNIKVYKRRGEHLSYIAMQNLLPGMKQYKPWLKDADSQALKYACRQVDNAYQKFFKHEADFPQFHKKHGRQGYTTTNMAVVEIQDNKAKLPCLGWIKVQGLPQIPENATYCNACISREPDGTYYVSINYKYEAIVIPKKVDPERIYAMDYKSDGLYVGSDGITADMPHHFRESQAKLTRAQRQLSKKQGSRKGEKKSSGWRKQHRRVANIQKHIADQRQDYLQKLSKELADTWDAIGVEDLDMRAMSNKNFGNGKATLDNGFGEFRRMLDYKLQAQGKPSLIKVDRFYQSSQICSCCGHQNPELKDLSIRKWICPECGAHHDRDQNAAINIQQETMRLLSIKKAS